MIKNEILKWKMEFKDYGIFDCSPPCSMYSVLFANGKISDPFFRDNEYALTDLSRKDCEFSSVFNVTEEMLLKERLTVDFEGIDTVADIYINGVKTGYADNMHCEWEFDIKPLVTLGENKLLVHIYSPVNYMEAKQARRPIKDHADAMWGFGQIRKSSCMMGWDWAPKLPDMGLYRKVYITAYDSKIDDIYVRQKHSDGKVYLDITAEVIGDITSANVYITAPDGTKTEYPLNNLRCEAVIDNPQLWWPNGIGEHPLYNVQVKIYQDTDIVDEKQFNIGLRTMEVSTAKDKWGSEFCFVVNGVKIFAMGADYVPEDSIIPNLSEKRTEKLIKSCVDANHNCIRVWGGGFYQHEWFYDLCDRNGIIVWQDFMFGCVEVKMSEKFKATMQKELIYNIKRLRNHACIGLLCGNNEMEVMTDMSNKTAVNDHIEFYEHFIPEFCDKYAPDIFYWPSSPSSGGGFSDPNGDDNGDQHYWGVWHGSEPFEAYRKHFFRFCSEFGFESFPSVKTINSFTEPEDRNPLSFVMESHQKCIGGITKLINYTTTKYKYPTDLHSFIYTTQVIQADAIRYGVEHFRRYRGRCMGAVYWQLNDCWPVASWASIDYYGRWKALHYASKRFFAPVLLSLHKEDDNITINISNERLSSFEGSIKYGIKDSGFAELYKNEIQVNVNKMSSKDICTENFAELIGTNVRDKFMYCELLDRNGNVISNTTLIFTDPKFFVFKKADIKTNITGGNGEFTIYVQSDGYAKFVELDFENTDVVFSDNYFDLIDSNIKTVTFTTEDKSITAEQLQNQLTVYSTADIGRS